MPGSENLNLKDLTVLVVDDQQPMRRLLTSILADLGVGKMVEAPEGAQALAEAAGSEPDVISTDYLMKPMDGLELVKRIRGGDASVDPVVPIIMISGKADMTDVLRARDAGINEFLVKPFSAKLVMLRLNSIINNPRVYIRSADFFGPDRRRRQLNVAEERRKRPYTYTAPVRKKDRREKTSRRPQPPG